MRFIITAQPGPDSASNTEETASQDINALFTAYMRYNEELHKAGVLVAAEGLNPKGKTAHVRNQGGRRIAVDGPYAETKELIGGFYVVEVSSIEEAIQWALRCPTGLGFDDILEIRPLTGSADIPPDLLQLARDVAPSWSTTFDESR